MRRLFAILRSPRLAQVLRNSGTLLSGDALGSLCGLAALALAARRLSGTDFGILVLAQTYVEGVESLVTFNSWQALIHFGSLALERGDTEGFRRLVKLGVVLDFSSAAVGAGAAAVGAMALRGVLHWGAPTAHFAMLYSVVLLLPYSGAPLAVLRIFGRFSSLARQFAITGVIRAIGVAAAYQLGFHLGGFVVVWLASDVLERVVLLAVAWRELRTQGHLAALTTPVGDIRRRFPGVMSFLVSSNLLASVKTTTKYLDVIMVARILGPAAGGAYRIGKQLATASRQLVDPVTEALYPELAGLWARGAHGAFRSLCLRLSAIGGALGVLAWAVVAVAGRWGISLVFGARYLVAFPMMVWMMGGVMLALATLPLESASLAMGRAREPVAVLAAASAAYVVLLAVLLRSFGLAGAGMAFLVYYVLWLAGLVPSTVAHARAGGLGATSKKSAAR